MIAGKSCSEATGIQAVTRNGLNGVTRSFIDVIIPRVPSDHF
jgi:hypothetical protein